MTKEETNELGGLSPPPADSFAMDTLIALKEKEFEAFFEHTGGGGYAIYVEPYDPDTKTFAALIGPLYSDGSMVEGDLYCGPDNGDGDLELRCVMTVEEVIDAVEWAKDLPRVPWDVNGDPYLDDPTLTDENHPMAPDNGNQLPSPWNEDLSRPGAEGDR